MKGKSNEMLRRLSAEYADTRSALEYKNAYELLVATILAAQCTDKRVNIITKDFFRRYPDAYALAKGESGEVEALIRTCGLYKAKAKNLLLNRKAPDRGIRRAGPVQHGRTNDPCGGWPQNSQRCAGICIRDTGNGGRYPCGAGCKPAGACKF